MKTSLLLLFMIITVMCYAQEVSVSKTEKDKETIQKSSENSKTGPVAVHRIKSGSGPNPLIQQVRDLAEGDDIVTEKVIRHLKVNINPPVERILTDDEFRRLGTKEPIGVISESDVKELIKQLK